MTKEPEQMPEEQPEPKVWRSKAGRGPTSPGQAARRVRAEGESNEEYLRMTGHRKQRRKE